MGSMMRRKYFPTGEELQIIRDNYDGSTLNTNKIMRLLGRKYPRYFIRKKAAELGLTRSKKCRWTQEEEAYLADKYPEYGLKKLQKGLKLKFGVFRSTTAIKLKLRRLHCLSRDGEGFTMRGLCDFLWAGKENHHLIMRWIEKGWLKGKRRGTLRTQNQGGDSWCFSPENVRSFVIAHPEEIDLRCIDPVSFIRLIAGKTDVEVDAMCPRCRTIHQVRTFNPGNIKMYIYCPSCKANTSIEEEEYYCIGN